MYVIPKHFSDLIWLSSCDQSRIHIFCWDLLVSLVYWGNGGYWGHQFHLGQLIRHEQNGSGIKRSKATTGNGKEREGTSLWVHWEGASIPHKPAMLAWGVDKSVIKRPELQLAYQGRGQGIGITSWDYWGGGSVPHKAHTGMESW